MSCLHVFTDIKSCIDLSNGPMEKVKYQIPPEKITWTMHFKLTAAWAYLNFLFHCSFWGSENWAQGRRDHNLKKGPPTGGDTGMWESTWLQAWRNVL